MSEMAAPVLDRASTIGEAGGGFNVFSSLRDGTVGEDFSSGIDDIGEEVNISTDEAAGKLDLVAVAGGEEELPSTEKVSASIGQTACVTCVGCPFLSQCIKPQALAVKQESERQDNVSDDMNSADEEAVPNLMEMTPKQSYLDRLLAPDDFDSLDENGRGELVMAGYSVSTDYQESITKKAPEPVVAEAKPIDLTTKTDGSTEKIIPQEGEDKTSTNQAVEASGENVDTEVAETPFFELKTAPEIAADDTTDAGKVQQENVSEASVNTSGEEHFTEPTEENRPSIEIKQQTSDVISSAADKENQQPAFDFPDIPTQTKTRTVPSSPGVSEDTQTGDDSCNPLKNETVYPTASKDKVAANVVENTYDGDENTASSSIKIPSIEHQKENDFVITGSKSANSEPSRAVENDESATPVSEQQHLAAQFEAVKVDESAIAEPVDNSNMKSPKSTQRSEVKLEAVTAYNDFTRSSDYTEGKQPEDLALDVGSIPLPQKRMTTASVPAKYDENETYQSPDSYSIGQSGGTPQAVLLQEQILVESSESSLAIGDCANFDNNLIQLKIGDVETDVSVANDVVNTTNKTDVAASIETIDITPNQPDKHTAVDRNDTQLAVDLPQELGDELAVGTDAGEPQIPAFRQLDRSDAAMGVSRSEDKIWTEEEVFFVEQDLPGMEPELTLAEVAAVISPVEAVTALEEVDELPETRETNTALQLNYSKSSVREIAMYDSNERETQTISLPIIEKTTNVELDKIIPKELYLPDGKNKTTSVNIAEKSDLPHKQYEALAVDADDLQPVVNLPKESEAAFADEVAEAMNYELGKQGEPIITSDEKKLSRNSEADTADNSGVIVNTCPSLGLWPDDSRLNPEEEVAAATQSVTDSTSLVSRLVGMFVVAMCVVRGRQSVKV